MLIANIRWYRTVLEMQGQVTGSDFIQGLFDRRRPKASLWRMILKLPSELKRETEVKWWAVAKLILKDYWLANPEEAKTTFRQLEFSAASEAKTPKTIAIKAVHRAFRTEAARGPQVADSVP